MFHGYLNTSKLTSNLKIYKTLNCIMNKIDHRETGRDGMDWIDLAQDRDQWRVSCEHGNELSSSIKCWEVLEWLHNWRLLKKVSAP
jgi:hypothetical protein